MIETICICGAGTMGSGIAQTAAVAGLRTLLYDVDAGVLEKGLETIQKNLQAQVEKKKISTEAAKSALGRISPVSQAPECQADLILEAIVEKLEIKQSLFTQLAAFNKPTTILATNTSSLSVTALAAALPGPGRVAGMHFFNPAPVMKLVEIVRTEATDGAVLAELMELSRRLGKTPVLCKDAPGFIVNHVARPYYLEALRLLEEGVDMEAIDELMESAGFRMGPFRLMDLIGNDVNYAVSCSVYEAMGRPARLKPSPVQEQKVKEGQLGKKSGKGYYNYLH